MTGLSVLYAKAAAEEPEWAAMPDRDRTGRLREVYWARRVKSKTGPKSLVRVSLQWPASRTEIGRRTDDPGDDFVYLANLTPRIENRFEWQEVTEVFTTVPASRIEGAMRAWNGIADKHPLDFDEFLKGLHRGRPSRVEQRRAADQVIAQIGRKLAKSSYRDLLEKYGYGTLVVGMPLWFAVPPDDPLRLANVVDDFVTRTTLGLEEIRHKLLRRRDCPFSRVIVIWETTPQALHTWWEQRSALYEDAVNASLENPMGTSTWGAIADAVEPAVSCTETPASDVPSMCFHLDVKTQKKASGTGPYPKTVEVLGKVLRKRDQNPLGLRGMLKSKVSLMLCKLLCFLRIHGVEGLERWVVGKFSVSRAWRVRAVRQRARRFYRESRRRGREFGKLCTRDGSDGKCRISHMG